MWQDQHPQVAVNVVHVPPKHPQLGHSRSHWGSWQCHNHPWAPFLIPEPISQRHHGNNVWSQLPDGARQKSPL